MDDIRLLIDFGSTFSKVVAVNLGSEEILSRVQVPSTVDNDITIGLKEALEKIGSDVKIGELEKRQALACSSAAGGLRMVCVGFVPELSCEAARRAALGAGAKIVEHYSFELTSAEVRQIEDISPDLILLAGGTDGGNKNTIIHNASMLSHSKINAPIVVAGNKSAYDQIGQIFYDLPKVVKFVENVMPEMGKLEVQACREAIREVFMQNIVKSKGLDKAKQLLKDIIMPTPVAVMNAAALLAEGVESEDGLGELIVIDVGGATTDVYSIAGGTPNKGGVLEKGLPEPFAKRTVEGDLGVRYNIDVLLQIGRRKGISFNEEVISIFQSELGRIPRDDKELSIDAELARTAVETAFERHVGRIEITYSPIGEILIQVGKDLSKVTRVIGTGGPVTFSSCPEKILNGVLANCENAYVLKPERADFYIDEKYIMYAVGLLSQSEPKKALKIMKKYLKPINKNV